MTPDPVPLTRDLVLIGGGHAHALVLRRWGMKPLPGARLTLINPAPTAPYTGMLPGHIAGHYDRAALEIDLVRLARFAGARWIAGRATGIDRDRRTITIAERGEISYDIASIDIGITAEMPELPGFAEHGVAAKPMAPFARRWAAFADRPGAAAIAVIGAGVAGVELAMAMAHARAARNRAARITVIDRDAALAETPDGARRALLGRVRDLEIEVIEHATVRQVTVSTLTLEDGRVLPADLTVGAAGARPHPWLAETGLATTDGYLDVDAQLRTSDPAIYAAGDCAHLTAAPRPKAGVFAVRAAPVLAHNLRADLAGGARRPFRPQRDYLKLVSLGGKSALGEKWGLMLQGPRIWTWKDRIDRRFMAGLSDLPVMAGPARPADAARGVREALGDALPCGGCGAKVGPAVLTSALVRHAPAWRPDVTVPPGDDAALIGSGENRIVISTDHLRAFTLDPHLMARIAAVHAMGDIWAMGATPQAALATLILPRMSDALQARWLDEIMAAATGTFSAAGATLAGGHTTIGAELTIGFTVTGTLTGAPRQLSGARPGDALVLTRPIGSGTILAAEMQGRARGTDVTAVLAEMTRLQSDAAEALGAANAMTDVTGFGLAGHLLNIADASGAGAEIDLDRVPLYDGAADLARAGIRSSLFPGNRAKVAARMTAPDIPETDLLFDPQTAGGLLAALPPEAAEASLQALKAAGHRAALIGRITGGPPALAVRAR